MKREWYVRNHTRSTRQRCVRFAQRRAVKGIFRRSNDASQEKFCIALKKFRRGDCFRDPIWI